MAQAATVVNPLREKLGAVSAQQAVKWLNLLVYGDPGAGKTHLIGTAQDHPNTSPILLIDVEGGTATLRNRKDIDVVRIKTMTELKDTINTFANENDGYYKTLAIDTLSELQKLDMADIMYSLTGPNGSRPDLDPDVPGMREWGKSSEHIRRIVRAVRDLECNTIITCHSFTDKDPNTNRTTYAPSVPGKLRVEVPGFMDIVGYLRSVKEDDEIVRYLQVIRTDQVMGKDRTNSLGESVRNPTIPMLWNLIHEGI